MIHGSRNCREDEVRIPAVFPGERAPEKERRTGIVGSQYPKYKFDAEGDAPSFLYLMPTGLNGPDGDNLTFKWWIQSDAGTYSGNVNIANSTSSIAKVNVPSDSAGKSFHVICEVTDNGTHKLTSYRRIIFEPAK